MSIKHSMGACSFEFKKIGVEIEFIKIYRDETKESTTIFSEVGPYGAEEIFKITHTDAESETVLTSETSIFEIMADQAVGPVYSRLSDLKVGLTTSIFFEPEIAANLTAEWRKGKTGYGLGNLGAEQPIFSLTIKPLGANNSSDWLVLPHCRVKTDLNVGMSKEGKSLIEITVTASSDTNKASDTYGLIMVTGDYQKN